MDTTLYIKSNAFHVTHLDGHFVFTNILSGKCFRLDSYTTNLLDKCSERQTLAKITTMLTKDEFSDKQAKDLIDFLVTNKLIISDYKQSIYETTKQLNSFFNVGFKDLKDISPGSVVFIGIPFGYGNDVDSGCKNFPHMLRSASSSYISLRESELRTESIHESLNKSNLIRIKESDSITDIGDIPYISGTELSIYRDIVTKITSDVYERRGIPFSIGGDHSITYPIIQAAASYYTDFTILHFDAHADYKQSKLLNLYRSIGLDMLNHATVMNYCERVDKVSEIIQFGVREPLIVTSPKIKNISLHDLREKSSTYKLIKEATGNVYLSFDIDYFDPTIAPGTASTLINGGLYDETFHYLADILSNKTLVGFDLVEANHRLDQQNKTIQLAINLILQVLSHIKPYKVK